MRYTSSWKCAVCGAVAALTTMLIAGTASAGVWHYGVRGGLGYANLGGDFGEAVNPDWRLGPALGAFVEHEITSTFTFALEVNYVQKGAKSVSEGRDSQGAFFPIDAELA